MSAKHETPRDLRKKLGRATASHKSLKDKCREKQYELKKLNNCLSAMQKSRDKWRLVSKEKDAFINDLKKELSIISKECDDFRTQIATTKLLVQKKTR
jgi:hypothetical protein